MKKLLFLFALLVAGLVSTAQPLQRTVLKGTQYIQSDTLKSINGIAVSVDGNRLTNLANPVNPQDAVTLKTMQDSIAAASINGGSETDPVFGASVAASITEADTLRWGAGGTETDPVFSSWDKSTGITVTATQVSDFDTEVANNSAVSTNTAKVSNATHTGEVTGSSALTIASDVVDYGNVAATLKGAVTDNDGAWDYSVAGVINAAISTNTTVTFSNLQLNKQLKIRLTLSAGATITWPAYVTVQGAELGDGTFKLYADCWNAGSGTEDLLINIIAE